MDIPHCAQRLMDGSCLHTYLHAASLLQYSANRLASGQHPPPPNPTRGSNKQSLCSSFITSIFKSLIQQKILWVIKDVTQLRPVIPKTGAQVIIVEISVWFHCAEHKTELKFHCQESCGASKCDTSFILKTTVQVQKPDWMRDNSGFCSHKYHHLPTAPPPPAFWFTLQLKSHNSISNCTQANSPERTASPHFSSSKSHIFLLTLCHHCENKSKLQ